MDGKQRSWMLDAGGGAPDTGCRMPYVSAECWHWMLDTGVRVLNAEYSQLDAECQMLATGCKMLGPE